MDRINKNVALEKEARSQSTSAKRLKELATLNDDLAEIVASNVSALPELLAELATHKNKAVRKAVTSNPNTPIEKLFELGKYFSQELLDNPAFELLYLEDANFIEKIPIGLLSILIQYKNTSRFILDSTVKNEELDFEIIDVAKMHVTLSGEMTEGWHEAAADVIAQIEDEEDILSQLDDSFEYDNDYWLDNFDFLAHFSDFVSPHIFKNEEFKHYLARNPKTKTILLKQLAYDLDPRIREELIYNCNLPVSILKQLANDSNDWVRARAAGNLNTPRKILKKLAGDLSEVVRMVVAKNINTPSEVLEKLANDRDPQVRSNVSRNKNTPLSVLEKFAVQDKNSKKGVAINHGASVEILEILFAEGDEWICGLVARNPATSTEMLAKLASDSRNLIRVSVAENLNTPANILEKLAFDLDVEVRLNVAINQNTPTTTLEQLASDLSYEVPIGVAMNLNTTANMLEKLATHSNREVRLAIAKNPNTPITTLEQYSISKDRAIRIHAAENPNTPLETLERLANDLVHRVRVNVAENSKCTHEIKETIFKNFAKLKTPSFCRVALFLSDYAESYVLAENSNSISWLERYAIAQNQKTPQETLKQLAQDGNRIVRATAKESLQKYY